MNTENLNGILAQYIQYCKTRTAAEEGTVWRAADCFGVNWDIEDSDFPGMFADAMQQAQLALDNPALQPIGGVQTLMLRETEVELVRECFRWLFKEDDGDIAKRRGRAELCIRIGECEQKLQEMQANPAKLPDLTDCKISHKMFGAGTVRPAEGQFMVIDFNGTLKKFSYTASMNSGYLTAEDPAVEAELQAYQDYNKEKDRLEKELKNMKAELVKL